MGRRKIPEWSFVLCS